jgi:hypothetical protein
MDLSDRFPGFDVERGPDGLLHAWLAGTDPPLIVTGKDEADLRDQIRAVALGDLA